MRRPLCWLLCVVVLWIICLYEPPDSGIVSEDKSVTLIARVDEITGYGDDLNIIVNDVMTDSGDRYCDRLQGYAATNYKSQEKSCSFSHLKIGNIIRLQGDIKPFRDPGNPGQFNETSYYRSMNIDGRLYVRQVDVIDAHADTIAELLRGIRMFFCDAFYDALPEREAGIMTAMVLGEKSGLEDEVKELYRENGIAHILAISGLHISVIGMGLFFLLRKYVMPMQGAVVVTGVILLLYGQLTGFPLSTRRAVIMTIIMLVARLLGEANDRLNALALAALIELIMHPESLWQSGFLLSYGTVLGITVFVGEFRNLRLGSKRSVVQRVFTVVSGSLGVFFVTLPILIQCYHEVAIYSVPVNLIILPFMSVLMGMSLAGGGIYCMAAWLSRFVLGTAYYILQGIQWVCSLVDYIPHHTVIIGHRSAPGVVLYYAVIGGVAAILHKTSRTLNYQNKYAIGVTNGDENESVYKKMLSIFVGKLIGSIISRWLGMTARSRAIITMGVLFLNMGLLVSPLFDAVWVGDLTITNLDIGQGDCICIRTPDGRTVLIDGGSTDVNLVGKYRIVPYLKYCGIDTIDVMVMTHSDEDHISGFTEILEKDDHFGLMIRNVVIPQINDPDDNYIQFEHVIRQVQAQGEDIVLRHVKAGDRMAFGDVSFTCLHPSEGYEWEDANDYSTVLLLKYGGFSGIFTGDLGFHGEDVLLSDWNTDMKSLDDRDSTNRYESTGVLDIDYLKVGHHGSKYSSSEEFLAAISPEIAVASAGENNRYHHPADEAVERIEESGAEFYCTIQTGALTTRTDGENIWVSGYKE